MIKTCWKNLSDTGLGHIQDSFIQRKIRLFNRMAIIVIFPEILMFFVWGNAVSYSHAAPLLLLISITILSLYFNKIGRYNTSRTLVMTAGIVILSYFSIIGGRSIMTQVIILFLINIVFAIFDFNKERGYIYFFFTFISLDLIFLETYAYDHIAPLVTNPEDIEVFYNNSLIISLVLVVYFMIIFAKDNANSEAELVESRTKAEKALKIKSEFLSNMSHEIRTPLNSILGFSTILSESNLEAEQKRYLKYVSLASENMLQLVNDILDFSKMESDTFSLNNKTTSISNITEEVISMLEVTAKNKMLHLSYSIDEKIHDSVLVDAMRLKQIIINLVSNAIKFTEKGKVDVSVYLIEREENKQTIRIDVTDTGIGINEKFHKKIFEGFSQMDSNDTRAFQGTGLGLSIVKKLVEVMGGQIVLNSSEGVGSVFSVILCLNHSKNTVENNEQNIAQTLDFKGVKVLVVDDNEMNQLLLQKLLSNYGTDTTLIGNGIEALELLQTHSFDLILLDLQMPEITGLDIYRKLEDDSKYLLNKTTPVAIITADVFYDTKKKINKAGIDHILTKPISRLDLEHFLIKILKK